MISRVKSTNHDDSFQEFPSGVVLSGKMLPRFKPFQEKNTQNQEGTSMRIFSIWMMASKYFHFKRW